MIKRIAPALCLVLGSVFVFSVAASAQVNTPAAESSTPGTAIRSRLILVDKPRDPQAGSPDDLLPQHLREMLADPQLRQQEISRRVRVLRSEHPDFGRVLSIDATTEEKVLALLADAALMKDIGKFMLRNMERRQQEARSYDELIRDVARTIGVDKLDAYLDYDRTRNARSHIRYFDATLPPTGKLTEAQKDAMVPLLVEGDRQQLHAAWLAPDLDQVIGSELREKLVTDVQRGGSQLLNVSTIYSNENGARVSEVAGRALLEQLSPILDTEQLRLYREQQAQYLAILRASAQQLRRTIGVGLDLPIVQDVAPSTPTPNLRLQITLHVNGTELTRTLTSARGSAVRFDGPEGLQIEAQPVGSAGKQYVVELSLYEPASRGRRLVGGAMGKVDITNPQQPANPLPSHVAVLNGRKSYVIEARVSASLL